MMSKYELMVSHKDDIQMYFIFLVLTLIPICNLITSAMVNGIWYSEEIEKWWLNKQEKFCSFVSKHFSFKKLILAAFMVKEGGTNE